MGKTKAPPQSRERRQINAYRRVVSLFFRRSLIQFSRTRYTPVKKAEKMAIKSRNSNSGPRKKPMASLKRLMIYSTKSIKEHTILTCGKTRFNICDHSPSPT